VDRRAFLRLAATAGVLAPLAAACGESGSPGASPTPTRTGPATGGSSAPTHSASPASATTWQSLGDRLEGTLVRPGQARYQASARLFDPRFDGARPQGVAYCASAADVSACVRFAADTGTALAVRAGGHSYGGYSTGSGLVLDVTRMATVRPGAGGTATVGAGARLVDVYSDLAAAGVSIPAGSCPSVGVAGMTLGGGIGVVDRRYGLTCDRMLSAEVVLASGDVVRCDAKREPDLYWALRGGGGGTFGVVTSFTFATHATRPVGLFTYRWDWPHAAAVLAAWQRWAPGAPDELWSNCLLSSVSGGGPASGRVVVNGVHLGGTAPLAPLLGELVDAIGAPPRTTFLGQRAYLAAMLIEAGCAGESIEACHLPTDRAGGTISRSPQVASSDFVDRPFPAAGTEAVVAALDRRRGDPTPGGAALIFDAAGGAVNRVAPGETAFVHRRSLASIQYVASYPVSRASAKDGSARWVRSARADLRPYVSGAAYQNYLDPTLTDWARAYYGDNLTRLRRVKGHYDPGNLFHYAQSVTPA
jgi:FAD/FMN-containing dehydrogenase